MELNKSFTINGNIVEETNETIAGYELYTSSDVYDSSLTLYFVDKQMKVKASLKIEADCGQNMGYISDWVVRDF